MITVMGASGNVGGGVARRLLEAGQGVRALGRTADKLAPLTAAGAEVVTGDAEDAALLPYDDFAASLVEMGLSRNAAFLYTEMARALNEGRVVSREGRRPENSTPTRFEEFAEELAKAYAAT